MWNIWNKNKMKNGIQKIPDKLMAHNKICPLCGKKLDRKKETFNNTGSIPYIRHGDKFYDIHKECCFMMYEGLRQAIESNIEEYTAYMM